MTVMPESQGSLDGLCGIYAIVNALTVTSSKATADQVFQSACMNLSQGRWPSLLWEGTTIGDLQRMVRGCIRDLQLADVEVRYPFHRAPPKSNDDYWARFDQLFSVDGVLCAIMGISSPHMHWIVASHDGAHIQFLDSTAGYEFQRKRRSSLFAGERKKSPSQWLLDRRELILFSRI